MKQAIQSGFSDFLTKLKTWEKSENNEHPWTLTDAFWLMHTEFRILLNNAARPEIMASYPDARNARKIIENVRNRILHYYSEKFEKDFLQYIDNRIDTIYKEIISEAEASELCIQEAANYLKANSCPSNPIYTSICAIFEKTGQLCGDIKKQSDIFPCLTTIHSHSLLLPADIPKISNYIEENETLTKEDRENLLLFQESMMEQVEELRSSFRNLALQSKDCDFRDCISFCKQNLAGFSKWQKYIINLATLLEYAIDASFNRELILIFLFANYEHSIAGKSLQFIIERQENFFHYLYETVVSASPSAKDILHAHMNTCPREITESYYHQPPPFIPSDDKRPLLFSLKKLIALYRFYADSSNQPMTECVRYAINAYDKILKETKFDEPAYSPMLDDLPSYVLNTFGLNQSDLARILGVENYVITREKKSNALIQNHLWFWTAATNFTYTYMMGETTIPDYGKLDSNSKIYGIGVMGQMAYAELFLRYAEDLSNYRKNLLKNGKVEKTRYVLDREYIQKISDNIMQWMDSVQKSRELLDKLYAWHLSIKQDRETELSDINAKIKDKSLRTDLKLPDLKERKIILQGELDMSEQIFNKAMKNFQNALEYRGKLLSVWNPHILEKFLSDIEEASITLKKAYDNRNKCMDFDIAEKTYKQYMKLWEDMNASLDTQAKQWKGIKIQMTAIKKV